ncbi:MAG: SprT family zinc-dependent metalloprotease [Coriobacteriia bacterium]|nr:SprT family zinc-dependent metalloprotease [Coriobacteriia bacterium]
MSESGLPDYTVRMSARARRIRLTVSARDGLVVTLPQHVATREAARAVAHRREWAISHLAATEARRRALTAPPEALLPSVIELPALNATWVVEYRQSASGGAVRVRANGPSLHVTGNVADADACLSALRRWRDRAAHTGLAALLEQCSKATDIPYSRVSVRFQKTRWGSCSSAGTISLNRNLVFLPEALARYVVMHELAHVQERGHGPGFWAHLGQLVPDARALRARMREAGDMVPAWADA